MKARISARARYDLDSIFARICAREGTESADRFLDDAEHAVAFLAQHPDAGPHPTWITRHKTLRFWVISKTNYLIYYFSDDFGVSVARILDGRRDVERIIDKRRESEEVD